MSINIPHLTISQILHASKLKGLADDNFKFYENGRKLPKWGGKKNKNKRAMMALYRSTGWYLGICLKHKTPKKG